MPKKRAVLPSYTIVRMKLAALNPAPYNPRTISEAARKGLKASIQRYGCVEPIIANKRTRYTIVGGHRRYEALLELGETETDVVVVDLPLAEEKALNIALNNPAIAGEFTADVAAIIGELRVELPDLIGDLRLDSLAEIMGQIKPHEGYDNVHGDILKPQKRTPTVVVQIGDVRTRISTEAYERLRDGLTMLFEKEGTKYHETFAKVLECCIGKLPK